MRDRGLLAKLGEDKLAMRDCVFSSRKRSEASTEPFLHHRISHTYPKLGKSSLAMWAGFFCFSILFSLLALTRRALFNIRPNKRLKARC